MIYDSNNDEIQICVREFIAIARRAVSPSTPYGEEDTEIKEIGKRLLASLGITAQPIKVRQRLSVNGENISVFGEGHFSDSGKITLASLSDRVKASPSKELSAAMRGEGFVLGYIYAKERGLSSFLLTIVYISATTGEKTELREEVKTSTAEAFFSKCLDTVLKYSLPERERVKHRLPTMRAAKFPYENVREGQSEFVKRAYRTISRGGSLFALAPTGTGKTVSAIFPAIRAMGEGRVKKTFYLTPKTTTAKAAKECIELLCSRGTQICAMILTAKERSCKNGLKCRDGRESCPRSSCSKLSDALTELYLKKIPVVTVQDIYPIAEKYSVCPYELELTYSEICDLVICDFNYLFDPRVYIRRFFDTGGSYAFLIDEAHNLPDRAREMFSAEISAEEISGICESELLGEFSALKNAALAASHDFYDLLYAYLKDELRTDKDGAVSGATHLSDLPGDLFPVFERLITAAEEEIHDSLRARDEERGIRLKLLYDYYYKIRRVYDAMQAFDSSYRMFLFFDEGILRMKIYCLDTGARIREGISKGHAAVFFSATLSPLDYYRALLGGDGSSEIIEVDSPFAPEQLSVSVIDKISTRYSMREDTLLAVCRTVAATLSARRGHYIVFSPSFAYSEALYKTFKAKYPKIASLLQTKDMSQAEKNDFLSAFEKEGDSYLVAFCVMGGIFAEGIDLAGESLIGAVVVGIGLPSISYEREAIAEYFEERYEAGKEFAYVYPGMNRVLQAAGRVIRREEDRGVIVLIDDRFDDPIYKKSLPKLWRGIGFVSDARELKERLDEFWKSAY